MRHHKGNGVAIEVEDMGLHTYFAENQYTRLIKCPNIKAVSTIIPDQTGKLGICQACGMVVR